MQHLRRGVTLEEQVEANGSAIFSLPLIIGTSGLTVSVSILDVAASTTAEVFSALEDEDDAYHSISSETDAEGFTFTVVNLVGRFIKVTLTTACRVKVLVG